ncbi:TPA: hypothetical protein ACGW3M_000950 [Pseudomonas aeruginosa]|uniref:hypothetical protein n=1 Tax=Pseudomonas aeruginosa TaxID=287 RepID=UPI0027ED22F9|nr:hypothetical protein [Pseudomonas aeruginosa]ELJ2276231.1 hypothetical protein [Pseudomonas aeruginosa]MBX6653691.1 hypothetical protein [Pseudomonas aeruginosa]
MSSDEAITGYCPCCDGVHQQQPVGRVGGTQVDGCDVDFATWRCTGCGSQWSGDLSEEGPNADEQALAQLGHTITSIYRKALEPSAESLAYAEKHYPKPLS